MRCKLKSAVYSNGRIALTWYKEETSGGLRLVQECPFCAGDGNNFGSPCGECGNSGTVLVCSKCGRVRINERPCKYCIRSNTQDTCPDCQGFGEDPQRVVCKTCQGMGKIYLK